MIEGGVWQSNWMLSRDDGFKEQLQLLKAQRYAVTYVLSFGVAHVDKWLQRQQVWVMLPHLIY